VWCSRHDLWLAFSMLEAVAAAETGDVVRAFPEARG